MSSITLREATAALATSSTRALATTLGFEPPISVEAVLDKVAMFRKFVDVLQDVCRGECTGFGWVVFDRDRKTPFARGGEGVAVRAAAGVPAVAFTEHTRLNVHSISKTIAAAVIVRALYLKDGVSLDSRIGPFLRPSWPLAAGVEDVTFKQLLVHDSGLVNYSRGGLDGRSYAGVKQALALGLLEPVGARGYQNVNFSLCRMLLPYLDDDGHPSRDRAWLNGLSEDDFNDRTIDFYIDYVHEHFFPGDVPDDVAPEPNGPKPYTRYYDQVDASVCDIEPLPETHREHVGASSWCMSALEYGRFISRLRFDRSFGRPGESWSPYPVMIDAAYRTQPSTAIDEIYRLGLTDEDLGSGQIAFGKSGGGGGGRPSTAWLGLGDLTAVLLINSSGGTIGTGGDLKALAALDKAARAAIKVG